DSSLSPGRLNRLGLNDRSTGDRKLSIPSTQNPVVPTHGVLMVIVLWAAAASAGTGAWREAAMCEDMLGRDTH
ncbi:hypothetical protein FRC11_014299, partial [Ceratobasidium sp. 423]